MIGRLTGRVVEEGDDGSLVLDVAGVGYEVTAPLGTLGRARALAADTGPETITLFVHTHVREDAFLLYGFATREDREVFRILIGISSIGPKIGVAILSAMGASDLAAAIARRESSRLTAIPGVGKKTAERLVLELKDKLIALPSVPAVPAAPLPSVGGQPELLHGALTRMGYRPAEAERAIAALGARVEGGVPLGELVRDALALLSR